MARALRARALAASLIAASRSAFCALRSALCALRSALCARRRGRCAPVCRAGQPLAAIAASRYALGADGVGAARPGACGSLVGAERAAQGADGVAAARPGAYCAPFPILAHVGSWWWGCRRRRAQRAARDARCNACFELLPRSRVEGSGKVIMTRVRPPNDRMPLPHVQCESVRRVTGTGAPSPQATPVPPTGSARTATVRAAAVLTGVLVVGQSCLTQ